MSDLNQNPPATVPEQREAKPPLRKSMPVVIALVVIIGLIGLANISSLLRGNKRTATPSALPMRPSAPNAAQVSSFEAQQQLQAKRDEQDGEHEQEVAAAMQQLRETQGAPGPEASGAPPMTAAQRSAIYGDSPNARLHSLRCDGVIRPSLRAVIDDEDLSGEVLSFPRCAD